MQTTIDRAGRLVVPKALRDQLGLVAGPVEVTADGAALRVEPVTEVGLDQEGDWLVIPASGQAITTAQVQEIRDADQR
ncbi:MAG: AbrB/MazE/SpoVT family DNA-binding domain-containing protein [Microthrixaceae bacterium]